MNGPPFVRKTFFDQRELVGAQWWHETMALSELSRRRMLNLALFGGATALVAGGGFALWRMFAREEQVFGDAVDLQRDRGWTCGATGSIDVPWPSALDAKGSLGWPGTFDRLAHELGPHAEPLQPYYVPTLFQSLAEPGNQTLRDAIKPMCSPAMRTAEAIGAAFASLFEGVAAHGTAIIVDVPGPEAVAFATGASARLDPVFLFDNWPHPSGVVPSHQTLAAALYHFPRLRETAWDRLDAPALFVLDRARLSPYAGQASLFDNRYVARMPTVQNLEKLGIAQVLYVTPDASSMVELDDLNDDFVAFRAANIDVRAMALTDFWRHPGAPDADPYWFGGRPETHWWFWRHYGWHVGDRSATAIAPSGLSAGRSYAPERRRTMFSGVGPAKTKPGDFGKVAVAPIPKNERERVGPSGGSYSESGSSTGYGGGYHSSGSWGRGGSGGGSGGGG